MHVPANDENPGHPFRLQGVIRGDGHVAEKTESHGNVSSGMVSRRPNGGKRRLPLESARHCFNRRSRPVYRRRKTIGAHHRVLIDSTATPHAHLFEMIDIFRRMNASDHLTGHRSGLNERRDCFVLVPSEMGEHRLNAGR